MFIHSVAWGHMGGGGHGWMWLWGPVMMIFWIAVVGLVVCLIVRLLAARASAPPLADEFQYARDILAERYADGEITTEEYTERVDRLGISRGRTSGRTGRGDG